MLAQRSSTNAGFHLESSGLRLLFANSPVPMYVYDLQTFRFLQVNDAAVSFYGYSHDEFSRMTIFDIRHEDSASAASRSEADSSPAVWFSGEWCHQRRDGSIADVEVTRHLIQLSGRDAGLGVVQDISARKSVERELAAGRREIEEQLRLAQNSEAVTTAAARVAHDFNNVIGAIVGWCELGAEQSTAQPKLLEYFSRIGEQANRALGITRELRAIAVRKPATLAAAPVRPSEDSRPASSARNGRETILLVENHEDLRESARLSLERAGYAVVAVGDGVSALECYLRNPAISLVVVDLLMPRIGGLAAIAQMREARPDLPVVFTTGYAAEAVSIPGAEAGRDAVLQKPYDPSELLRHVRALLDRRRFHEVLDTVAGSVIFRCSEGV